MPPGATQVSQGPPRGPLRPVSAFGWPPGASAVCLPGIAPGNTHPSPSRGGTITSSVPDLWTPELECRNRQRSPGFSCVIPGGLWAASATRQAPGIGTSRQVQMAT